MRENQFFIVIEGIDGCGKSTQLDLLAAHMQKGGRDVARVQDPGTAPLAQHIRELLLHKTEIEMTPHQEAILFTTARSSLVPHLKGLLESGTDVLCDRWLLSTLTYQGIMGGVSASCLLDLHQGFVGIDPDICIVLDVPAEVAADRRKARAGERPDRFESRPMEWQQGLAKAYIEAADLICHNRPVYRIQADKPPHVVFDRVLQVCRADERFQKLFPG